MMVLQLQNKILSDVYNNAKTYDRQFRYSRSKYVISISCILISCAVYSHKRNADDMSTIFVDRQLTVYQIRLWVNIIANTCHGGWVYTLALAV